MGYYALIWFLVLDCADLPYEVPEGVEVYYQEPYDGLPLPKNHKIYYRCLQGRFPDGRTWRVGVCRKDGSGAFDIAPMEECTMEAIKVEAGEDKGKPKAQNKIKRKAQAGGKTLHRLYYNILIGTA